MKVSELFYSIQGEGKLAGAPSAFIRVAGCNLRCTWCDTPYASWQPEGEEMGVEAIIGRVKEWPGRHAVVTGGEPMIMAEIGDLCERLKGEGYHVTVETAGTVYRAAEIDLASLSPKLSNSTPGQRERGRFAAAHERQRLNVTALQQFIDTSPEVQLKFVVCGEGDMDEIEQLLGKLRGWRPADVLLMPEGTTVEALRERSGWIIEQCKRTGYRYCPRLHVEVYGNRRGT